MASVSIHIGPGIRSQEIPTGNEDDLFPACRGYTHIFYGDYLDVREEPERREREAVCLSICENCHLQTACLEAALRFNEKYGVWGNMTQGERQVFKIWLRQRKLFPFPLGPDLEAAVALFREAVEDCDGEVGLVVKKQRRKTAAQRSGARPATVNRNGSTGMQKVRGKVR